MDCKCIDSFLNSKQFLLLLKFFFIPVNLPSFEFVSISQKALMNYLAHAFLNPQEEDILFGNLIADFVKGKNKATYTSSVQQGIALHRSIDAFTDRHPVVQEGILLFRPHYRWSGPVFLDILFDFYLANDPIHFSEESLLQFTKKIYRVLQHRSTWMNDAMQQFFGYMQEYNWLYHYRHKEGIERSIRGMCKRFPVLGDPDAALELFAENEDYFESCYQRFFPDLQNHVKHWIMQQNTSPLL